MFEGSRLRGSLGLGLWEGSLGLGLGLWEGSLGLGEEGDGIIKPEFGYRQVRIGSNYYL